MPPEAATKIDEYMLLTFKAESSKAWIRISQDRDGNTMMVKPYFDEDGKTVFTIATIDRHKVVVGSAKVIDVQEFKL